MNALLDDITVTVLLDAVEQGRADSHALIASEFGRPLCAADCHSLAVAALERNRTEQATALVQVARKLDMTVMLPVQLFPLVPFTSKNVHHDLLNSGAYRLLGNTHQARLKRRAEWWDDDPAWVYRDDAREPFLWVFRSRNEARKRAWNLVFRYEFENRGRGVGLPPAAYRQVQRECRAIADENVSRVNLGELLGINPTDPGLDTVGGFCWFVTLGATLQ